MMKKYSDRSTVTKNRHTMKKLICILKPCKCAKSDPLFKLLVSL